jgi:hypothetical protein
MVLAVIRLADIKHYRKNMSRHIPMTRWVGSILIAHVMS